MTPEKIQIVVAVVDVVLAATVGIAAAVIPDFRFDDCPLTIAALSAPL